MPARQGANPGEAAGPLSMPLHPPLQIQPFVSDLRGGRAETTFGAAPSLVWRIESRSEVQHI